MKPKSIFLNLTLVVVMSLFLVGQTLGKEAATKEECVAKVQQAVKLLKEVGPDEAIKKFIDRNGPFVWKDSYVFCVDNDQAKMLAHPFPGAVGMNFLHWKDAEGKEPFVDILKMAADKGEGWKSYMHLPPGAQKALLKTTYFVFEPESKLIVGAGYYTFE